MPYFIKNSNQTPPAVLVKGMLKSRECRILNCGKTFKPLPWDTGDRLELCKKHRLEKAEAEAEEWNRKIKARG